MLSMKTWNTIIRWSALFMLSSCMQFKYTFISPGRVQHDSLKAHITHFNAVSDAISGKHQGTYEVIGHGVTSWRNYPMGISKRGFVYGNNQTEAWDIVNLMDKSWSLDSTISIELDAQYVPPNDTLRKLFPTNGAYILHNIPLWGQSQNTAPKVLRYLENNTLGNAVRHFVNKGYYRSAKMYIEIKVAKENFQDCDVQCTELANELKLFAKQYPRSNGENWLCIMSFSPHALEKFRSSLPEDVRHHCDYMLIAGHTYAWPKSRLAQAKGYVPKLDDTITKFIIDAEWLDGVWFSTQGVRNFKSLFSDMVAQRSEQHPDWKAIRFCYATYQMKRKKMTKTLTKHPHQQINVKSFMLDFDDKIDKHR